MPKKPGGNRACCRVSCPSAHKVIKGIECPQCILDMPNLKEQNLQVHVDIKTHRFHASRGPLGTNTISKTILIYTGSIGRQK